MRLLLRKYRLIALKGLLMNFLKFPPMSFPKMWHGNIFMNPALRVTAHPHKDKGIITLLANTFSVRECY